MENKESLVPVAAEAGPREEITDETGTRMDQRISEVRGSQSEGLAVEPAVLMWKSMNWCRPWSPSRSGTQA